jgi:DNA-binding NarL/FixJ family response regulator
MPVLNGLEAAHEILESGARTKVLMLTVHDSDAMIHKVVAAGARVTCSKPTRHATW